MIPTTRRLQWSFALLKLPHRYRISAKGRGLREGRAGEALHTIKGTEIELSDQAREFIAARGGTLYLRVRHNRCCSGGLTFLDATTSAHRDDERYQRLNGEHPDVRLLHLGSVLPAKVNVEVRGKVRKHLVAFWDGCAYRL
jgi:hypothetical protein